MSPEAPAPASDERPPHAHFTHLGFYVRDIGKMSEFYCRILGMAVTDRGEGMGRTWVFMSGDPEEHHQIVMASGRGENVETTINQVSFRVSSLHALQRYYVYVEKAGVEQLVSVSHGNAWSVYFLDPEGNRIELYTRTPWYVSQPHRQPIDLREDAETVMARTEAMIAEDVTRQPVEDWSTALKKKLNRE